MVTTVGYQDGARRFAEHYGIGLKVLRPPTQSDWENRIKNIQLNIKVRTLSSDFPVDIALENWEVRDQQQAERLKSAKLVDAQNPQIYDCSGTLVVDNLAQWLCQRLPIAQADPGGPYSHALDLEESYFKMTLPDDSEEFFKATKMVVKYYVSGAEETISVLGNEVVQYILKDFLSGDFEYKVVRPGFSIHGVKTD